MSSTLFLSGSDVATLVQHVGEDRIMEELIDRMQDEFAAFDSKRLIVPARTGFHYETPYPGLVEWMPIMERGGKALLKMVAYHPRNPAAHRLPTILSTFALFDTHSGHLEAVTDGTFLTALRTGAASAVASRLLGKEGSSTLGLIGAGAQAMTQLHAISRVHPIERVLVFDTDESVAGSFAGRMKSLQMESVAIEVTSLEEVMAGADILSTATSVEPGAGPVFRADMPRQDWLHINAVGSDFPNKLEVPEEVLWESFVCPDFLEQVGKEGECQQLQDHHIGPEILEVARHPERFARYRDRPSVFDSTGFALEDLVVITIFLEHARANGIGRSERFESIPRDPYNPYEFLGGALPIIGEAPSDQPTAPAAS